MRLSPPSLAAGIALGALLAAVPAWAAVVASDQNPTATDFAAPTLTVQPATFTVGSSIDVANPWCFEGEAGRYNNVPMRIGWTVADATSGVASTVFHSYDLGVGGTTEEPTTSTSHVLDTTNYDDECGGSWFGVDHWLVAKDFRGFTTTTPTINSQLDVYTEAGVDPTGVTTNLPVTRTGTWSTSTCTCHNGGTTAYTSTKGGSITYTVTVEPGQTVAIVAPKSSNRGVMNVTVDGGTITAVNTYAATTTNRVIVWQKTLTGGQHTIKITNAGTTGRGRIDVDTVMLGPAWSGEVPVVPGG